MNKALINLLIIACFGFAGFAAIYFWLLPGSHWSIGAIVGAMCAIGAGNGLAQNETANDIREIRDELRRGSKH